MIVARNQITIADLNDGKKGDPGTNGVSVVAIPGHLVFDTDNKGRLHIADDNANRSRIIFYEGLNAFEPDKVTVRPHNCTAVLRNGVLTIERTDPLHSHGRVEVTALHKGKEYTVNVTFYVSKQRWNDSRFENTARELSSVKQRYESWQGRLDTLSSEIRQIPGQITLEVSRQTSGGTNLLKGASLRHERISLEQGKNHAVCIHETIKIRHADNHSHAGYPYLEVNVSGYTADLYSSARFWVYLESGKTYTCSFYYKYMNRSGSDISLAVGYAGGYTDNAKKWLNGSGINPLHKDQNWHIYQKSYTIGESGYYIFAPALIRNGHVLFSEVQLEEGIKATSWKDPDIVESIERSGINLQTGRITARADNFVTTNNKGEVTSSIDADGNFTSSALHTFNKNGGSIYAHDGVIECKNVLGITQIKFGLENGEQVIKFYDKAGAFIANFDPVKLLDSSGYKKSSWGDIKVKELSKNPYQLKNLFNETYCRQLFNDAVSNNITLSGGQIYIYSAPRNGRVYAGEGGNYWDADTTAENDGKAFTLNKPIGNFVAHGIYLQYFHLVGITELPLPGGVNFDGSTYGTIDTSGVTQVLFRLLLAKNGKITSATKTINIDGTIADEYEDTGEGLIPPTPGIRPGGGLHFG